MVFVREDAEVASVCYAICCTSPGARSFGVPSTSIISMKNSNTSGHVWKERQTKSTFGVPGSFCRSSGHAYCQDLQAKPRIVCVSSIIAMYLGLFVWCACQSGLCKHSANDRCTALSKSLQAVQVNPQNLVSDKS
jgi:hypothetical protein